MMLIDLALADRRTMIMLPDDAQRRVQRARNVVKRYVFNRDASDKVEFFSLENAHDVCLNAHFAQPPYADSYIEINRGEKGRIAYLFCADGRIYVLYGDDGGAVFTPFVYTRAERAAVFDRQFDKLELGQGYLAFKLLLMVGMTMTAAEARGDYSETSQEKMVAFTAAMGLVEFYDVALVRRELMSATIVNDMTQECKGDLRSCVTAMLLLSERRISTVTSVAARRGIVRGKLRATPAHHVVTIDLDRDYVQFRKLFASPPTGTGVTPREHDVSAHYVHWNCSAQCQHRWVEFHPEQAEEQDMEKHGRVLERYICELCGGRKTRKLDFVRGDATKGRITKEYKVIASKQKQREKKRGIEQGEHDPT